MTIHHVTAEQAREFYVRYLRDNSMSYDNDEKTYRMDVPRETVVSADIANLKYFVVTIEKGSVLPHDLVFYDVEARNSAHAVNRIARLFERAIQQECVHDRPVQDQTPDGEPTHVKLGHVEMNYRAVQRSGSPQTMAAMTAEAEMEALERVLAAIMGSEGA